jgi:hypothetical protein
MVFLYAEAMCAECFFIPFYYLPSDFSHIKIV